MSTINQQASLYGQAHALIEEAVKAAPVHVGDYLDAVAELPEPLVDVVSAKCFGAQVDLARQQRCVQACTTRIKELNEWAVSVIQAMYRQNEALVQAATRKAQEEAIARDERNSDYVAGFWITMAIFAGLAVVAISLGTAKGGGHNVAVAACAFGGVMLLAVAAYFYSNIER